MGRAVGAGHAGLGQGPGIASVDLDLARGASHTWAEASRFISSIPWAPGRNYNAHIRGATLRYRFD